MTFAPGARQAARLGRPGNARDAVHATGHVIVITRGGKTLWWGIPRAENRVQWGWLGACNRRYDLVDRMYSDGEDTARAAASTICPRCPIQRACREAGINGEERYGVWGGIPADSTEFRALIEARRAETAQQDANAADTVMELAS